MEEKTTVVRGHEVGHGSVLTYTIGFGLSIVLTLIPYWLVSHQVLEGSALLFWLAVFASLQLFVQLFFFLHLGRESKPRWNLLVFLFMLMVLIIVVAGSLWIMHHLNYNMMSPQETETYLRDNEDL